MELTPSHLIDHFSLYSAFQQILVPISLLRTFNCSQLPLQLSRFPWQRLILPLPDLLLTALPRRGIQTIQLPQVPWRLGNVMLPLEISSGGNVRRQHLVVGSRHQRKILGTSHGWLPMIAKSTQLGVLYSPYPPCPSRSSEPSAPPPSHHLVDVRRCARC